MTTDILSEEHQAALHEENLQRFAPKPITSPPGERQSWIDHGLGGYKQIPFNRHYAADLDFANAAGALAQSFCEAQRAKGKTFSREDFRREVFKPLTAIDPELVQERPGPEKPLPAWPVDEISGLKIANPYLKNSLDLASQAEIEKRGPELAAWMKKIAEHGGAPTFAMLEQRQAEIEARTKVRELVYTEATHKGNVFLLSREEGALQKQSEFARANPDYIRKFFQREATVPLRLPFQGPRPNQTHLGQAFKHSPELGAVITRAEQIYQEWNRADVARLRELSAHHEAALKKAEQQLAIAK